MRRLIAWIGRFAAALLFRRVEVADQDRYPGGRPVLLVANHFNGFVDPVLITSTLGRIPRFVARAGLAADPDRWLAPPEGRGRLRPPPGRRGCGDRQRRRVPRVPPGAGRAATSSRSSRRAPRTTAPAWTRSRQAPPASRSALGPPGPDELVILPVGLTFPDKVALRSSALVQFGHPIDLDVVCPGAADASDTEAVRELTAVIDRGLRDVSPDFPDVETALALEQAALVALSSAADARPVPRGAVRAGPPPRHGARPRRKQRCAPPSVATSRC